MPVGPADTEIASGSKVLLSGMAKEAVVATTDVGDLERLAAHTENVTIASIQP